MYEVKFSNKYRTIPRETKNKTKNISHFCIQQSSNKSFLCISVQKLKYIFL